MDLFWRCTRTVEHGAPPHLVGAELELVARQAVAEAQGHGRQVRPRQPRHQALQLRPHPAGQLHHRVAAGRQGHNLASRRVPRQSMRRALVVCGDGLACRPACIHPPPWGPTSGEWTPVGGWGCHICAPHGLQRPRTRPGLTCLCTGCPSCP